jgi:hypothetical protein
MRARWLIALAIAVTAMAPRPASADDEVQPGADAYVDDHGSPTAEASDGSHTVGAGASAGDDDPCEWRVLINDDTQVAVYDADGNRLFSRTGRWLIHYCPGDDLLALVGGPGLVPEGGRADPAALAEEARRAVPISSPAIHTSPDGDRRLYTQVATWLWVDDSWWQPYTITVTAGRVTTTLTATPRRAVWDTGDGGGVPCEGPGVAWQPGMSDDATYCKHTYRHSSAGRPGGAYPLTVTIEFDVSWTSNIGAAGGLAGVTRTATREVQVGEIEAVEG